MTAGAVPSAPEIIRSVAAFNRDPELICDVLGAQLSASELAGAWWRPSAGTSRAARRRGDGPCDPARLAGAYARQLERAGDDDALTVLRALQVGADPEWRATVGAAADRLAERGRREPAWWPPPRERLGKCIDVPWDLPDGRFDVLAIEVFQGAIPIGLAVVLDHEGSIVEILLTTEMAGLLELPEEHGGRVDGDPRWRTPAELGHRLITAVDRTDLFGPATPPSFLPGTGYPALRGLLRTWLLLVGETAKADRLAGAGGTGRAGEPDRSGRDR